MSSVSMITGFLPERWEAKWINPELTEEAGRKPASVLRRRFPIEEGWEAKAGEREEGPAGEEKAEDSGSASSALLSITCHGLYAAYLNGERVGDFVLAPGTGDYHKRLPVQTYEVTELLRPGENEIRVVLGDGWYRGCVGIDGLENYYGTDLAMLCQLSVGGKTVLASGEGWEASQEGPIRVNDLELGETYDARREEITGWHPVKVMEELGYENLAPTLSVPILEQERFEGRLFTAPNGETVLDFGQNLAGYTELRVTARAGQRITLWHGETLDENGNFTQKNFEPGERNPKGIPQRIDYICKDGENVYHPSFSLFGFRYAKVESEADLSDARFTAIAVYSQMPRRGYFTCGNEAVNRLVENTLWSMRSNFCDIPTDCPTRERAGWTGDAGIFAPTAVYLADCYPVLRKWLGECRLAQGENGLVQNIAPVNDTRGPMTMMLQGSAGWGDACILVPWALYEAYGKKEILEENYEMMCRWVDFCTQRAKETRPQNQDNPWAEYLVDTGFHFGEWCEPGVENMVMMKKNAMEGAPEVATAYFYRSVSLLARIAGILGRGEEAGKYEEMAGKIRKAYRYHCLKDGRITSSRQCEYVRPLAFGLLSGEEEEEAAKALHELAAANGYHLGTGFLSTPDLCPVLAEHGYADTAYRLLLQEECPGWLYEVKKGATTIWETWDGVREDGTVHDSLNHYSYGAVTGWLFGGVCGIRLRAGELTIAPVPGKALGFASARWDSPVGKMESGWRYEGQKVIFEIEVPVEAQVKLPGVEPFRVLPGRYVYEQEAAE